ncbi:MAG TPA: hypothetical protein VHX38_11770 [Pseudonocardiaceae bacterium]|nr:hypothetical protein [Pseudonocardiaceae bacterium]
MRPGAELGEITWAMLNEALECYADSPRASDWLRYHMDRYREPLRVALAGPPECGKSTLVNAMVGERIAPIGSPTGVGVSTWFQDGPTPRATVYSAQGPALELPVTRGDNGLQVDPRGWQPHHQDRVVVDWPTRTLREATLIDTPAIGSATGEEAGATTLAQISGEADGVLYLTKQPHGSELQALQAAPGNPVAEAAPVNLILVLAKADELGAGRIDALSSAKQVARRYRGDERVRCTCQSVVSVAGMLGLAGKTLRDNEFGALQALARVPRQEAESFLISADRFLADSPAQPLPPAARVALLERFGLFGIRLAATLLRRGFETPAKLSAELVQRSGLGELREAISQFFTDRRDVLKSRSALLALDGLTRTEPRPNARRLVGALERLLASAHDFRELRLLAALQAGQCALPTELDAEANRLVGGQGTELPARLGLDEQTGQPELHQAIVTTLRRWRDLAENPILDAAAQQAAQVVLRSCEGMLGAFAAPAR